MICYYSGTPGSGKSLHLARDIYNRLNRHKYPSVISSININLKMIKNKKARFTYVELEKFTVKQLVQYALKYHTAGIENQTMLVFDEAHRIWNSREWQKGDRSEWLRFFSEHRHLGYNIIIISQNDRQLDRQIRSQFEYEIKHRKINNYKVGKFLPVSTFIAVLYWYGINEKIDSEIYFYRKKWGRFYDSYASFKDYEHFKDIIEEVKN